MIDDSILAWTSLGQGATGVFTTYSNESHPVRVIQGGAAIGGAHRESAQYSGKCSGYFAGGGWLLNDIPRGRYRVEAYIPFGDRLGTVTYQASYGSLGTEDAIVNQAIHSGEWVQIFAAAETLPERGSYRLIIELGTVPFDGDTPCAQNGHNVAWDAVRFTQVA